MQEIIYIDRCKQCGKFMETLITYDNDGSIISEETSCSQCTELNNGSINRL